ncbi:hypothetical protein BGZ83_007345 [Gryganskiella cystojenkinii]|nr:hypothetical protein BGZ83_007345 [Gryganskiella cystojenkinii]
MASTINALKQRHNNNNKVKSSVDDNITRPSSPVKSHSAFSPLKTILSAWGLFLAFLGVLVLITYQLHYTLPTPVFDPLNAVTGQVQFSEENARKVVRHLATDIGYRIVGTEQELETKKYLIKELSDLKENARIAELRRPENELALPNFDMWVQVGDGSHRFDFMSKGK